MSRPLNTSADSLLFKAGVRRTEKKTAPVSDVTLDSAGEILSVLSGTFRYDAPGSPIKSTQQLNVDFSDFSQHTFFNSAEAKTQKAFDRIINKMPFDGKKTELITFVDSLTGFEKYVFDRFPAHSGYLFFSGTQKNEDPANGFDEKLGTYLEVNDFKGASSPTLSNNPTGEGILDPKTKPFTLEFHFCMPEIENDNQVILQKKTENEGFTLFVSASSSTSAANVTMLLRSGTIALSSSAEIKKGEFHHIAAVYSGNDKDSKLPGRVLFYNDAVLVASSTESFLEKINFSTAPLTIGSGSEHSIPGFTMTPVQTLSGAIDELRVWHKAKTQKQIRNQRFVETFSNEKLKLLMRFNEPSGSYSSTGGSLSLDSSGNGLHTTIQNFSIDLRSTSSFGVSPMLQETKMSTIALFPSFEKITTLNSELLTSASQYDFSNPNLVTRLIPPHYLRDASYLEGFKSEIGSIDQNLQTHTDEPGGALVGQAQIIAGLLYTFSENFDELKMFIDEFKRLLKVDVLSTDTVSDQLMPWLSRYYGISLPNLFDGASEEQFIDGKNIRLDRKLTTSLQTIQNTLWRRVFSDLPYLFSTRGTHAGLRSILSNMGIDPTGPIRIKEYGGSSIRNLGDSYIRRHETAAMLDMSGTLTNVVTTGPHGVPTHRPFLQSTFLSGTRIEPGLPFPKGTLSKTGTNYSGDGLFTSGSWTVEGRYKFDKKISHPEKQSLSRIHVTGTNNASKDHGVLFNCVAHKPQPSSSTTGSIVLHGLPNTVPGEAFSLVLTGVDVFDGSKWYISYGRDRNDLIGSHVSSSYFVRAGKFSPAGLVEFHNASKYYDDGPGTSGVCYLQTLDADYNASGSFVAIGSQSLNIAGSEFLNQASTPSDSKETQFSGMLSSFRFYSKGQTITEAKTRTRNFKSLGVEDPTANFNFVKTASGSFQRLRIDASFDQEVTESNVSGEIVGFDFSQNGLIFSGSGFEPSKRVIKPERFDFDVLSANFTSGENPNKIRVRSYIASDNVETYNTRFAPLHDIPQNDQPNDDKRIAIEVSVTQGLNEDIMNIFATLESIDNMIGSPEFLFSQDYPELRHLRRVYFKRLTEKVNFLSFFEFFKFFDDTIGGILEQMLPSDSRFTGTSYVIESHALERAKFTYKYADMYLGEENRGGKDVILLQQFATSIRKF